MIVCVLEAGNNFTLSGTHWWHSHVGLQRGDGFVGPLIVRQPSIDNVHSDLYDIG